MIAVIEPTYAQHDHAAVNASLLQATAAAFPDEAIVFAASAIQRAHVTAIHPLPPRITPIDIAVRPPGGVSLGRMISQWQVLRKIAQTHKPRVFILLSAGPETFFAARAIAMEFPASRFFIVLHGNLADATGWRSRDPRRRLMDFRAGLAVARHPHIKLVVLEDYIRDTAIARDLAPADMIVTWPHPINAEEIDEHPSASPHHTVRIAFVGAATRRKGFDTFLTLIGAIQAAQATSGQAAKFAFSLIGAPLESFPEAGSLVAMPDQPLGRAEFVRQLRSVDYAVLLFSDALDRFIASGTLLDCVTQARPVIAFDLAGVRSLAASFGPIGHVCRSLAEMEALFLDKNRPLSDPITFNAFRDTLKRAALSRTPQATASLIRRDIDASSG